MFKLFKISNKGQGIEPVQLLWSRTNESIIIAVAGKYLITLFKWQKFHIYVNLSL